MMWGFGTGYGDATGSWIGMVLMMFFGLMVLVGMGLLLIWLVRTISLSTGGASGRSGVEDACDIARMRYARGEISQQEYYDICHTLTGDRR